MDEIKNTAAAIFHKIQDYQEHLHRYPELSFAETETSAFIGQKLMELGLKPEASYAPNSVVALIQGSHPNADRNRVVGLRADIDALPIEENPEHEVCSLNSGVMHACGHDLHTASLLGTAEILVKHRKRLQGDVLLIFQPAEENLPGGAKAMIDNGLLDKYKPFVILGQHVQPLMPVGSFGFRSGEYMASTDEIYINFSGHGGHAATPELTSNTVLSLARFIAEAQVAFTKMQPEGKPAVLSFGKLIANGVTNIIPDIALAEGTMRCFDEAFRATVKLKLAELADNIASQYKCKAQLRIVDGYPYVFNNPEFTQIAMEVAGDFAGKNNIVSLDRRLTAEDFAYFSHQLPSVFYRMGIAGDGKGETNLHNSRFDHDPKALLHSMGAMAWLTVKMLEKH